ncbi:MAG TPA: DUF4345 domain-containing protein [Trueperaceae bacterium]|jgi:hypothetical protein
MRPPRGASETPTAEPAPAPRRRPTRSQLAYVAAGVAILSGLLGLLNPLLAVSLYGLEVVEPRGLSQARATFGGLYLALGGMLLWAATPRADGGAGVRPYLRAAALLVGSVAAGRLLSIVIDGVLSPLNLLFLAFELAVCALSLLASAPRRPAAP